MADPDARVDGARACGQYFQRIDVELLNGGTGIDQRRDAQQYRDQCGFVDDGSATIAAQERCASQLVDHLERISVGERMQADRDVGEQLDERSTRAARDDGAK